MSQFSFIALIACAVFYVLHSHSATAVVVGKADYKNINFPGKCVLNANSIMSPGESGKAPNHPCASITCLEDGTVEFRTCRAVAPPKGCKQRDFVNTNRDFPACCERSYECKPTI
ncbi:uncharacterized protein LOC111605145 [Drosophila hydei]|uniref:Uncharacterized protein LOC111605145 n=1 Tax=Drosophila hydei TaxID=7224 RepID=A0A6J1MD12_DROHY|nr:uncharacterized protein LOC111605145 [Drosophila hydei]